MNTFSGILLLLVGLTGILACDVANIQSCLTDDIKNFDPNTGKVEEELCKSLHEVKECLEKKLEGCEQDALDTAKTSLDAVLNPLKEKCPKPDDKDAKPEDKDDDDECCGSEAVRMALLPVLAFALFAKLFVH